MYDIANFTIGDMTTCGKQLRQLAAGTSSMEECAARTVQFLHDQLGHTEVDGSAMALVRFFKTHDFADLDDDLQSFARGILGDTLSRPDMKCLTLLATAGDRPEWNSRRVSDGHKAIPLPSADLVKQFPMISNLVKQFGLDLTTVLHPDPQCLRDIDETTHNVFLVPDARGSAYIPAQDDFVIPFGIRSVLGFGGLLPSGNLFAIIMFSKVAINQETADLIRPLTLSVKMAVLEHDGERVFA